MRNNAKHMQELLAAQAGTGSPLSAQEMQAIAAVPDTIKCWATVGSCPENKPKRT